MLIEEGFDRLTMDAVARRCGASKATIYRRWPGKTALAVAAAAALFIAPDVPDTGDLREDLLACGRAYVQREGRTAQVLAGGWSLCRNTTQRCGTPRAQAQAGAPYGELFEGALSGPRLVSRGSVSDSTDVPTLAGVLPAIRRPACCGHGHAAGRTRTSCRVVHGVLLPRRWACRDRYRPLGDSQARWVFSRRRATAQSPARGSSRAAVQHGL